MPNFYLLINKANVVVDVASSEDLLCPIRVADKNLTLHITDFPAIAGDEFDPQTSILTARPENYPKVDETEEKISKEMRTIAIQSLKAKGELPSNFKE